MKRIILGFIPVLTCMVGSMAQTVGIGTNTPAASAALDINASNKGILIPRTSTASRTGIANPAKGLMIYDTTTNSPWFYAGGEWVQLTAGGSGWSLTGNTGTNPTSNFIGTTDAQAFVIKVNNQKSGFIDHASPYQTSYGFQSARLAFGISNTAFGYQALFTDTTGNNNTAHGFQALFSTSSGSYNTAIGASAMHFNSTGLYNTASGYRALYYNTDGYSNTGTGYFALYSNTYGHGNTATGTNALNSNTSAHFNSAFGYAALYSNTTGAYNTGCGSAVLYNNNGSFNTASGFEALRLNVESFNTAFGYQALRNTISSQYNVAVGYRAGYNLNNGYNNVFLGANTDVNGIGYYNVIAIGQSTICTGSSQVTMGNPATGSYRCYANWSNISDGRFKENMRDNVPGLEFINELRPVTYTLDATAIDVFLHQHAATDKTPETAARSAYALALKEKEQVRITGFVAQDVEKAAKKYGFDFSGVDAPKNEHDVYSLRYADFVVPLVKAMQEQQQMISSLQQLNTEQASEINDLKKRLEKLEALVLAK